MRSSFFLIGLIVGGAFIRSVDWVAHYPDSPAVAGVVFGAIAAVGITALLMVLDYDTPSR